ncbi:Uncharacterised protein [Mycobacteroides abscessus subsp. abscessus]|nr:Uncharacterised protein [Mycobacteroides abscessus subsp. abscessus]
MVVGVPDVVVGVRPAAVGAGGGGVLGAGGGHGGSAFLLSWRSCPIASSRVPPGSPVSTCWRSDGRRSDTFRYLQERLDAASP